MINTREELINAISQPNANLDFILPQVSKTLYFDSSTLSLILNNGTASAFTLLSVFSQNNIDTKFLEDRVSQILGISFEEAVRQKEAILSKIGLLPFYIEPQNPLFSEDSIAKFGINNIPSIYKYGYLAESRKKTQGRSEIDFNLLLLPENAENFIYIYRNILGYTAAEIDILSFLDIARKYLKNPQVFNAVLQETSSSPELATKLHEYFLCNAREIDISSVNDVSNIENLISSKFQRKLEFAETVAESDPDSQLASSYLLEMLTAKEEGINFLTQISSAQIDLLSDVLFPDSENKNFENLANLKLLINILPKIDLSPSESKQFLTAFMQELSAEDRIAIFETYSKSKSDLLLAYERELNESLTSIQDTITNIQNGTLHNSTLQQFNIDVEDSNYNVSTKSVPYIILREPSTLIQHVMNAYQKNHQNGKISLFSEGSGILTVPILSCTTIDNQSKECLENSKRVGTCGEHKINSKDDVTILFDKVPAGSLVLFGASDCAIQAYSNDLESVTPWTCVSQTGFDITSETIRKAVANGEQGTEYVFYLDKGLIPAGIRVMGDEPSDYEISAAMELGVPLVKLEETREKQHKERISKELIPTPQVSIAMERVNTILDRIIAKRKITPGQIGRISFGSLGDFSWELELSPELDSPSL